MIKKFGNREIGISAGVFTAIVVAVLFALSVFDSEPVEPVPEPAPEPVATTTVPELPFSSSEIIGQSVEGRDIEVVTFGNGETDLLFVGGIHGGYEWNSIILAYEFIDYFNENQEAVPEDSTIHIIPNLNPDGLFLATGLEGRFASTDITDYSMHETGEGRFNANNVDLNRNFDCKWAPESTWRGQVVSAGTGAFSEPEAVTLRDYVTEVGPEAVVFWHSRANNVYASECEEGVLPKTIEIMNAYATAGEYGAIETFDAYPVTGDAEGWLASLGIPAITVELETRTSSEWSRNLAGVNAMLEVFSETEQLAR
jgi:predicted deacylase